MAISKKLEIIYHNGQPDGIRSIRRNLSTMTTYVIPAHCFPKQRIFPVSTVREFII